MSRARLLLLLLATLVLVETSICCSKPAVTAAGARDEASDTTGAGGSGDFQSADRYVYARDLDPSPVNLPPEWEKFGDKDVLVSLRDRIRDAELRFALPDVHGSVVTFPNETCQGKVVLVNIWGTWCGGCHRELAHLVRLYEKYHSQGLEIIGIAVEEGPADAAAAKVKQAVADFAIPYAVLWTELPPRTLERQDRIEAYQQVLQGYEGFSSFPTSVYIGRDGKARQIEVGFKCETPAREAWTIERMERAVQRLLEEPI